MQKSNCVYINKGGTCPQEVKVNGRDLTKGKKEGIHAVDDEDLHGTH